MKAAETVSAEPTVESEVREFIRARLPPELAPAQLRLAFHDAGPFDVETHAGGADGSIRLAAEMGRSENTGWSVPCIALLTEAKARFPHVSWADLIAVGGAAAVALCDGPIISVGLGRRDAVAPEAEHRLPTGDADAPRLNAIFVAMGLSRQDLVVLSGAHTLGRNAAGPFTRDPDRFTNSYFQHLLASEDDPALALLPSDRALLDDPDLRLFVERYARDADAFARDFAVTYRKMTWLGGVDPDEGNRA